MPDQSIQRGFGLVELMVGVLISIIASIVIFQVFALSERQKRSTTGAADAQTNSAIALYMIERDIRMAGFGLETSSFANCNSTYSYYDDGSGTAGPLNNLFASVVVTDGGVGPDQLAIQYYDNPSKSAFKFSVGSLRSTMPQSSSELNVSSIYGCGPNDLVMVTQGGNCTLMQITQVQGQALKLQHNPGNTPTYNPAANYQSANGWPAYSTGAAFQCFSQLYTKTYRVNSSQLELREPDAAGTLQTYQVAPEIVDVQAQYGVADTCTPPAPCPQAVTAWVDATGAWASPLNMTNTRRIKAIRVAIVARSSQYEKPESGSACDTTTATTIAGWSSWATFSPVNLPTDWQCYRYKAFETVIPLRNVIWDNI